MFFNVDLDTMSIRKSFTEWGVIIIFGLLSLVSFMGAAIALEIYNSALYGTVLLSIATSFLATIVVFVCDRAIPRAEAKIRLIRGHEKIYETYKAKLHRDADGAPGVRTIASLPPSVDVARNWDDFLSKFLLAHPGIIYTRAVITHEHPEWVRRKSEIETRYLNPQLHNYRHFEASGPPSIECLLIADSTVFITFASAGRIQESVGLMVNDKMFYREVENYFDNQLLPRCHPRNETTVQSARVKSISEVTGTIERRSKSERRSRVSAVDHERRSGLDRRNRIAS
jgi:hypothetical protein